MDGWMDGWMASRVLASGEDMRVSVTSVSIKQRRVTVREVCVCPCSLVTYATAERTHAFE